MAREWRRVSPENSYEGREGGAGIPERARGRDGADDVDESGAGTLLLHLLLAGVVPTAVVVVEDGFKVLVRTQKSGDVRRMRITTRGRMEEERGSGIADVHRKRQNTAVARRSSGGKNLEPWGTN